MLKVAGIGPGNPKYITKDVIDNIVRADKVLAFTRVKDSLKDINPNIIEIDRVSDIERHLRDEESTLLLASGDPNFFGVVDYLKKKNIEVDEVLPGICAFQYFLSKLQKSWQTAKFISLHGRDDYLDEVKSNKLSIILTDKDNNPKKIAGDLKKMGLVGSIYVGINLSYDDEKIIIKKIGEDIEEIDSLSIVVVENEMD